MKINVPFYFFEMDKGRTSYNMSGDWQQGEQPR